MDSEPVKNCIESLEVMLKKERIDYSKIYNLMTILEKSGKLDKISSLLFNMLLKENFKSSSAITKINSETKNMTCINCKHDQFREYCAPISGLGSSGFGMKPNQNLGDLIFYVCIKCNFCQIKKPNYWT